MVVTLFHFSNPGSHTGFNYEISLISLIPKQTLYLLLDFMTLTFLKRSDYLLFLECPKIWI